MLTTEVEVLAKRRAQRMLERLEPTEDRRAPLAHAAHIILRAGGNGATGRYDTDSLLVSPHSIIHIAKVVCEMPIEQSDSLFYLPRHQHDVAIHPAYLLRLTRSLHKFLIGIISAIDDSRRVTVLHQSRYDAVSIRTTGLQLLVEIGIKLHVVVQPEIFVIVLPGGYFPGLEHSEIPIAYTMATIDMNLGVQFANSLGRPIGTTIFRKVNIDSRQSLKERLEASQRLGLAIMASEQGCGSHNAHLLAPITSSFYDIRIHWSIRGQGEAPMFIK